MKVQLIKLVEKMTPQGFYFSEEAVEKAITRTSFPVYSRHYPEGQTITEMMSGVNRIEDHPDDWEFRCTHMWIEDGYLVGDVEFLISPCRASKHPEKYVFFARVAPRDTTGQITVDQHKGTFEDFYFSSVAHRAIA